MRNFEQSSHNPSLCAHKKEEAKKERGENVKKEKIKKKSHNPSSQLDPTAERAYRMAEAG